MRRLLLSWYGITDLRSSLELEQSDGPVLAALKSGAYTDAVILAYTDPEKDKSPIPQDIWEAWEEWRTDPSVDPNHRFPEEISRLVRLVSNTSFAHQHFQSWLMAKLSAYGVDVEVKLSSHELARLNDVEGIHSASSLAVRDVVTRYGNSPISVYVSPGTPVMAFSWALIARSNPHLGIDVIASSDPSQPPEKLEIPRSLLDPAIAVWRQDQVDGDSFDLVIHLMGEQALPILFGIRQFRAKSTVLLTSAAFQSKASKLMNAASITAKVVSIADAFTPAHTRRAIKKQVEMLPPDARVAVNMTGGTKIMFAGALQACWELGLNPFYFEIRDHKVVFIRDGSKHDFVGVTEVNDFISASGFSQFSAGRLPLASHSSKDERLSHCEALWNLRSRLGEMYRHKEFQRFLREWGDSQYQGRQPRFELSLEFEDRLSISVKKSGETHLKIDGNTMSLPQERPFDFVSSRWLEDYVYELLRPLEVDGTIHDLRVGFEVAYPDEGKPRTQWPAQEFDCVFTDGKRLWIVECKAGSANQEALQKLDNNMRHYGGIAARGILVSSNPLTAANKRRLEGLPGIEAIEPNRLSSDELRKVIRKSGIR